MTPVLSQSPQIIVDGLKTQKEIVMEKKDEARAKLVKMYEGFLLGFRCTCLLKMDAKELLLKNINKILKDATGEEKAVIRNLEGCLDCPACWENRIEKWLA